MGAGGCGGFQRIEPSSPESSLSPFPWLGWSEITSDSQHMQLQKAPQPLSSRSEAVDVLALLSACPVIAGEQEMSEA